MLDSTQSFQFMIIRMIRVVIIVGGSLVPVNDWLIGWYDGWTDGLTDWLIDWLRGWSVLQQLDWEVELAIVIGKTAKNVAVSIRLRMQ